MGNTEYYTISAARSHDHQCAVDAGSLRRAGVNMVIIDFFRPVGAAKPAHTAGTAATAELPGANFCAATLNQVSVH